MNAEKLIFSEGEPPTKREAFHIALVAFLVRKHWNSKTTISWQELAGFMNGSFDLHITPNKKNRQIDISVGACFRGFATSSDLIAFDGEIAKEQERVEKDINLAQKIRFVDIE